jgi:hypothetical protein
MPYSPRFREAMPLGLRAPCISVQKSNSRPSYYNTLSVKNNKVFDAKSTALLYIIQNILGEAGYINIYLI